MATAKGSALRSFERMTPYTGAAWSKWTDWTIVASEFRPNPNATPMRVAAAGIRSRRSLALAIADRAGVSTIADFTPAQDEG